jgi:hypothetical protein
LQQEQKKFRLSMSLELRDRANLVSGVLRSMISGVESWVYSRDPETKMQSSDGKTPNSPQAKSARQSK